MISVTSTVRANLATGNEMPYDRHISAETWHLLSIIIVFIAVLYFIITMTKLFLEFRLKSKMIEKGLDDPGFRKLLQPEKELKGNQAVKWFVVMLGLGVGLLLISFTQPLGIHSFAILSLSLAASFLAYNFYINKSTR